MWLANALTLARIPLALAFWATYGDLRWSFAIVAVAALTDALDGPLARAARRRAYLHGVRTSTAGEWLDPVADKFFVIVAVIAIASHHDAPLSMLLFACTRELAIVPLGIAYRIALFTRPRIEHAFRADPIGKATTIAQLVALATIAVHSRWAPVATMVAGVLGVLAVGHYVDRATRPVRALP